MIKEKCSFLILESSGLKCSHQLPTSANKHWAKNRWQSIHLHDSSVQSKPLELDSHFLSCDVVFFVELGAISFYSLLVGSSTPHFSLALLGPQVSNEVVEFTSRGFISRSLTRPDSTTTNHIY